MGNYEQLKAAIVAVIKANGNNEITGNVLQTTLLTIISNMGQYRQFGGVVIPATNPGNPDQNLFYLAQRPGVYQYFSNVEISNPGLNVIYHNGTNWIAVQVTPNPYAMRLTTSLITRTDVANNDVWINVDSYKYTFNVSERVVYFKIDGSLGHIPAGSSCGLSPLNYDKIPSVNSYSALICWDENNNELIALDYQLPLKSGYIPLALTLVNMTTNWILLQTNFGWTIDGVLYEDTINKNIEPKGLEFKKTAGYVYLNTGLSPNSGFEVSDFIPVVAGQRIYFTLRTGGNTTNNGTGIVGLNANKEFVQYLWQNPSVITFGRRVTYRNRSIVIPAGVEYIVGTSAFVEDVPLQIGTYLDMKYTTDTTVVYGGENWRDKIVHGAYLRGTGSPGYLAQSYYYKGVLGNNDYSVLTARAILINALYVDKLLEIEYDTNVWALGWLMYDKDGNEIYFDRNNFYIERKRIILSEPFMFGIQIRKKDDTPIVETDLVNNPFIVRYKKANENIFKCKPEVIKQNYNYPFNPKFLVIGSRFGSPATGVLSNMFYTSRITTLTRCLTSYRVFCEANDVRISVSEGYDMFVVIDNDKQTEVDTSWINSTTYTANNVANKYIGVGIRRLDNAVITDEDIANINLLFEGLPTGTKELPYIYSGQKVSINNTFNRDIYLDISTIDPEPSKGSQQGFAIHGKYGFVMYDGGYCTVVNMDTKALVAKFNMGVVASNNHVNNANFGVEYPAGNPNFPAIYTSKFRDTGECYVDNITLANSTLIQTISLNLATNPIFGISWAVDVENNNLWAIGYKLSNWAEPVGNAIYYAKFRLPSITEGDIAFTDADVIERFEMPYRVHQGFYIKGGKIYAPWGGGNYCGMVVLDIATKQYITDVPLGQWNAEPEGIDEYNNNLIVSHNHGSHGQLIELTF